MSPAGAATPTAASIGVRHLDAAYLAAVFQAMCTDVDAASPSRGGPDHVPADTPATRSDRRPPQ